MRSLILCTSGIKTVSYSTRNYSKWHSGTLQEMNDFLNDLDGLTDEDKEGSLSECDKSPPGMIKMEDSGCLNIEPPLAITK